MARASATGPQRTQLDHYARAQTMVLIDIAESLQVISKHVKRISNAMGQDDPL